MNFAIVYYTNLQPFNRTMIPIGVILQTPDKLLYKFDINEDRFSKIVNVSKDADKDTFFQFEESFKKNYINVDKISITDEKGQQIFITSTDQRFLPYLSSTYQNFYQFSKPIPVETNTPEVFLDYSFKNAVT